MYQPETAGKDLAISSNLVFKGRIRKLRFWRVQLIKTEKNFKQIMRGCQNMFGIQSELSNHTGSVHF